MTVEIGEGGPDDERGPKREVNHDNNEESKGLRELLIDFDASVAQLKELISYLAVNRAEVETASPAINMHGKSILQSWKAVVAKSLEVYSRGSDEFVNAVCTLWTDYDHGMVDLLDELTPQDIKFYKAKIANLQDTARVVCNDTEEDDEDVVDRFGDLLAEGMQDDINTALNSFRAVEYIGKRKNGETAKQDTDDHTPDGIVAEAHVASGVQESSDKSREVSRLGELRKIFGSHVIDTFKIGIGVAGGLIAGLAVDRYLKRREK